MFDVEGVALDPDVMKFANKAKSGRSGSRGMIFSEERGRYIKPIMPKGRVRKLAVDATMRTAAPYQRKRRERMFEKTGEAQEGRVFIEQSDVRAKKMARKAGSLVIFVVDHLETSRALLSFGSVMRLPKSPSKFWLYATVWATNSAKVQSLASRSVGTGARAAPYATNTFFQNNGMFVFSTSRKSQVEVSSCFPWWRWPYALFSQ